MKQSKLILAMAAGVLMVGCGGGSSSSTSNNQSSAIPTAAIKITSANADKVAKGAMTPAQTTAQQSSAVAGIVGVVTTTSTRSHSVKSIVLSEFDRIKNLKSPTAVAGVVTSPAPMNCGASAAEGTMSFSYNDTSGNGTMGAGDSLSVSYSACNDGFALINGSMTFSITALSANLGVAGTPSAPVTAGFTVTFSNFSTKDLVTNATDFMSGDMTFSTTDDGDTTTGTISGTTFTMVSSVDGTHQMSNYNFTFSDTITSGVYSYGVTMTTADATMGGSVSISTPTPFTGTTGDPTAGVMVITGAGGSTLTLTAQADGVTVAQIVDEDGAGSIAPVVLANTTWAAI